MVGLMLAGGHFYSAQGCAIYIGEEQIMSPLPKDGKWPEVVSRRANEIRQNRGGILLVGDSIAWRWPADLQLKYFGHRFVNLGVSGDLIENVLWRLPKYNLKAADPPAVVLVLGTNDLPLGHSAAKIVQGVDEVVRAINSQLGATPIFVVDVLPRGPFLSYKPLVVKQINDLMDLKAKEGSYHRLHVHDLFVEACLHQTPCPLLPDYLHPSRDGYQLISEALREEIEAAVVHSKSSP